MAKNRIMIYDSKTDGTYVVEFRIADAPLGQINPNGIVRSARMLKMQA
jgi:hypothetical protein